MPWYCDNSSFIYSSSWQFVAIKSFANRNGLWLSNRSILSSYWIPHIFKVPLRLQLHFFKMDHRNLQIWHASCQTSRHLKKCRKEWREVDVHDWQTAWHGSFKKKKKKKGMKITVISSPLDRFLCGRQVEKNAFAVDYISRGVNLKADIHFYVSWGEN